ncbi:unnamed protein product [Ascophyllum nodosum]
MEENIPDPVDPLSYAADAEQSVLEEIARLDYLRESIRADQANYLKEHPEVSSLLNAFIRAVVEKKPADVFAFARDHFSSEHSKTNLATT